MRQSREFDNVLNECLERLLTEGETIEQCLQSFPKHANELKPLLETALATKQASAIQPRPEFRDRARYQLYSVFQETEHKRSRPFFSWSWQPRWATVTVAIVLVLLLISSGTVAAANGSMPDELLYPVKLVAEQVQLTLTPSALGKAELYAKLVERRVSEIARMAGEGKPEQIELTTQCLDTYLGKIAALSSIQKVKGGMLMAPAAQEARVVEEAAPAEEEAVAEKAPTIKEAPAAREAPLLAEQARDVEEARLGGERRARLRAMMVLNANQHPAHLRALLATVPESARPALLRAIAVSETGYEKALESLE